MRNFVEKSSNSLIKKRVLKGFNDVLNMLRSQLGIEWSIMSLERGLIDQDGTEIFQDYFKSTHSRLREESWMYDAMPVTKLKFFNIDDIVLSTKFEPSLRGKNIIFLDLIKEKLNPAIRTMLDDKLREIHYLEAQHFNNQKNVIENTKKQLIKSI